MEIGTIKYKDLAAVPLLLNDEVFPLLIDKTREKAQFVQWLEKMGRYVQTGTDEFHDLVNNQIFATEVIIDPAATVHTAGTEITVQVTSADGTSPFRAGETVQIPGTNRRQAIVVSVTADAGGDLVRLKSLSGDALELAIDQKLASVSIAGESGGGYVAHKKVLQTKRSGVVQIFPLEIAKITDVAKAAKLRIQTPGGMGEAYLDELNGTLEYWKAVGGQYLFGQSTGEQFSLANPGFTGENGNGLQTTSSIDEYIANEGRTYTGTTIGTDLFNSLKRHYAQLQLDGSFILLGGSELSIQWTDYIHSLNNADGLVNSGARYQLSGSELTLGIQQFTVNGLTFKLMEQTQVFDDRGRVNFTGSAGFQNFVYIIPDGNVPTVGGGSAPAFHIRYMSSPLENNSMRNSNGIYTTIRSGDLAPVPTGGKRELVTKMTSTQGLQWLDPDKGVRLILQSSGS